MNRVYIVTTGANNYASQYTLAFRTLEAAEKFRSLYDKDLGVSANHCTIREFEVYD